MNTAEQILDKHLELRSWTKTVPKNGNLYNTLIDALNEALSIANVVGQSEQLVCNKKCGKTEPYNDIFLNCGSSINYDAN